MSYPKQEKTCPQCEGYKRVAIITKGSPLFKDFLNKPLPATWNKTRQALRSYKGKHRGMTTFLVRELANNLDTTPCPWCRATGVVCTLQQLTPEEAAELRVQEESV